MLAPEKVTNGRGGKSPHCAVHHGTRLSDFESSDRKTVGKRDPVPDSWNPRASMAFDNAKGLLNPAGKNNCFLNSAVQVLWHLDAFRRNFRLLSGHAHSDKSCIFCALKLLFTQFQCSNHTVLPADALRNALAHTFAKQRRYQLGHMDDAAECFENILMRLHSHLSPGVTDDECQELHCIPHQKFSMSVIEQAMCECSATGEPFVFSQMVQYVSTQVIVSQSHAASTVSSRRQNTGFGRLVNIANNDGNTWKCPRNCGGNVTLRRTLTNTPDVVSIGFIWDSDQPSFDSIYDVVCSVETVLHPADMFFSVVNADWAVSTRFHLVGVVCYYGCHYCTFFFHSKMKIWILFDDHRVKKMGPNWSCVVDQCIRGRYQPLLLLYANHNANLIDASTAPDHITQLHDNLPPDTSSETLPEKQPHNYCSGNLVPKQHVDTSSLSAASVTLGLRSIGFPDGDGGSSESHQRRFCAQSSVKKSSGVGENHHRSINRFDTVQPMAKHSGVSANQYGVAASSSEQQLGLMKPSPAGGLMYSSDRRSHGSTVDLRKNFINGQSPSSYTDRQVQAKFCNQPMISQSQTDLTGWYSGTSDDVDCEAGPYINKAVVAKILERRKQKVGPTASFNRFSTPQLGRRNGAEFAAGDFQVLAPADSFDSISFDSFRDSGYRSNDDRHSSDSDSATLTASNSALSVSSSSGFVASSGADCNLAFLCSSSESLSSVQSGRSLQVGLNGHLRTIPENSLAASFDGKLDVNHCQKVPVHQFVRGEGERFGKRSSAVHQPSLRMSDLHVSNSKEGFEKNYDVLDGAKTNNFKVDVNHYQKVPAQPFVREEARFGKTGSSAVHQPSLHISDLCVSDAKAGFERNYDVSDGAKMHELFNHPESLYYARLKTAHLQRTYNSLAAAEPSCSSQTLSRPSSNRFVQTFPVSHNSNSHGLLEACDLFDSTCSLPQRGCPTSLTGNMQRYV